VSPDQDTRILVIAFVGLLSQFVRGVYLGEYPGPAGCWVAATDSPGAPDFERFSTG